MQQLDPKSVWLFFLGIITRLIIFVAVFAGYSAVFAINRLSHFGSVGLFIAALLIVAYIWARLSYHFYRYELAEEGFKKELGIIWKKYVTIPYDRIQNVDIYRGVFARLLGLSDIHIQTAGGTVGGRAGVFEAEGRLPGLSREIAEKLRDELIHRAKQRTQQGL